MCSLLFCMSLLQNSSHSLGSPSARGQSQMTWLARPSHQYPLDVCQSFLKALGVRVLKVILNMKCSNSNTLNERQSLVNDPLHNSPIEGSSYFKLQARKNCSHEIRLLNCPCPGHSTLRERMLISPGECGCDWSAQVRDRKSCKWLRNSYIRDTKPPPGISW